MRARRFVAAAIALALSTPAIADEASDLVESGTESYLEGRFGASAVELKAALGRPNELDAAERARSAFFTGRAFRELGLRGLALHYLGQSEDGKEKPWVALSQREMLRIYFEAAEYPAVVEVYEQIDPADRAGEPSYLAGTSLALLGKWGEAREVLGKVSKTDSLSGYARLIRAQARAAEGDLGAAEKELQTLAAEGEALPAGLADQARILRGKILYLLGRKKEGREAFTQAKEGGGSPLEVIRGLLLTGASAQSASTVEVSKLRPTALANGMLVKARAADEKDDVLGSRQVREQLRGLVGERRQSLDRLLEGGKSASLLRVDLAEFSTRLRSERWKIRAESEREALEAGGIAPAAVAPVEVEPFRPSEGAFYEVWEDARSNQWLHGLVELLSRVRDLDRDVETEVGSTNLWTIFQGGALDRMQVAILAIRTVNLRQLFHDHLFLFGKTKGPDLAARKQAALEKTLEELRELYVGKLPAETPKELTNQGLKLTYKSGDVIRLTASVPERSTDPASSLLGNYVDLLAEMRVGLEDLDREVPDVKAVRPARLAALRIETAKLRGEIEDELDRAMRPVLRRQIAFFIRLEADNEGALSRLFARGAMPAKKKPEPTEGEDR